jgi:hypothetical protein
MQRRMRLTPTQSFRFDELRMARTGGRVSTGGRGTGGVTDPLESPGSLTLSQDHSLLFAVNGGEWRDLRVSGVWFPTHPGRQRGLRRR